jgi:hypothetical protein
MRHVCLLVQMPSMKIEVLPTPFDTASNRVPSQGCAPLCEAQSLPANNGLPPIGPSATALSGPAPVTDTPSAFGLSDPAPMDDYVRTDPATLLLPAPVNSRLPCPTLTFPEYTSSALTPAKELLQLVRLFIAAGRQNIACLGFLQSMMLGRGPLLDHAGPVCKAAASPASAVRP